MGATNFKSVGIGRDANKAFSELVKDASHRRGHEGYTGTIAEKDDFVMVNLLPRIKVDNVIDIIETYCFDKLKGKRLPKGVSEYDIKRWSDIFEDKWGPALCVEIRGQKAKEIRKRAGRARGKVFVFFGMASE